MILSAIVAMDRNALIGDGAGMPWHLPRDLKRFRALTLGRPILMGRKTYDSIGRPLPGRLNIVITRDPAWHADGCRRAGSIDEAIRIAADAADEAAIIGGGLVFEQTADRWDRLHLTLVDGRFAGNTFFPVDPVGSTSWEPIGDEPWPADPKNAHALRFTDLERRADAPRASFDLRAWLAAPIEGRAAAT